MPPEFTEAVQRAAAYVAARARGDLDAAEAILDTFDTDKQRAYAFATLAELSIGLIARYEDDRADHVASRLALTIEQAGTPH